MFLVKFSRHVVIRPLGAMPSSDLASFRSHLKKSKRVAILTGAGVSSESGVPTFRGEGGLWRTYESTRLATPEAFKRDPSLVWEFYHYRRELVLTKEPNPAHKAIAELEERLSKSGGRVVVVTQNVDELHRRSGTNNLIELHGSLYRTRCTKCHKTEENHDSPICEALRGKGAPDPGAPPAKIPVEDLPRCGSCGGLLRPAIVWFGENLEPEVLQKAEQELDECDLCLVIGTSSVVYPAAMFAPQVAARGIVVAEFNVESTSATNKFGFYFEGPCGVTLPKALEP